MRLGAERPATDALDAGVISLNPSAGHSGLRESHGERKTDIAETHHPHHGVAALEPLPELGRSG